MQGKVMWVIFFVLSTIVDIGLSYLISDFATSLILGLVLTIPLLILSWWIAYKSGWVE